MENIQLTIRGSFLEDFHGVHHRSEIGVSCDERRSGEWWLWCRLLRATTGSLVTPSHLPYIPSLTCTLMALIGPGEGGFVTRWEGGRLRNSPHCALPYLPTYTYLPTYPSVLTYLPTYSLLKLPQGLSCHSWPHLTPKIWKGHSFWPGEMTWKPNINKKNCK